VLVAFERIRHCLGERTLAAPGLEARKRSREAAGGTEEVIHETREPSSGSGHHTDIRSCPLLTFEDRRALVEEGLQALVGVLCRKELNT
jgi:hypothetical protein